MKAIIAQVLVALALAGIVLPPQAWAADCDYTEGPASVCSTDHKILQSQQRDTTVVFPNATKTLTADGTVTISSTDICSNTANGIPCLDSATKLSMSVIPPMPVVCPSGMNCAGKTDTTTATTTATGTGTFYATAAQPVSGTVTNTGSWTGTATLTNYSPWTATGTGTGQIVTGADSRLTDARASTNTLMCSGNIVCSQRTGTGTNTATATVTALALSANGTASGTSVAAGQIIAGNGIQIVKQTGTGTSTATATVTGASTTDTITVINTATSTFAASNVAAKITVSNGLVTATSALTATDVGALPSSTTHVSGDVPTSQVIAGHTLTNTNVAITAGDVGAVPSNTAIAASGTTNKIVQYDTNGLVLSGVDATAANVGAPSGTGTMSGTLNYLPTKTASGWGDSHAMDVSGVTIFDPLFPSSSGLIVRGGLGLTRNLAGTTWTAGTAVTVGSNPVSVAISPDGLRALISNYGSATVSPLAWNGNMVIHGVAPTTASYELDDPAIVPGPNQVVQYPAGGGQGTWFTPVAANTAITASGAVNKIVQYDTNGLVLSGTTAGNSATKNVGTTAGTVAAGDDSRITGALGCSGTCSAGNWAQFTDATHITNVAAPTYSSVGADAAGAATTAVNAAVNGTNNYVAKFTGTNSIRNSQISDDGTTVTIGTASGTSVSIGPLSDATTWRGIAINGGAPSTGNYAIAENQTAGTTVNTPSGKTVFFNVGNTNYASVTSAGIAASNITATPGASKVVQSDASGTVNAWVTLDHITATYFGNNTADYSAAGGSCVTIASVTVSSTSTASTFLLHGTINGDGDYDGGTLACKMFISYDSNVAIPGGYGMAVSHSTEPYVLHADTRVSLSAGTHTIYMALCNLDSGPTTHCRSNAATSLYNAGTLLAEQFGH